MITPDVGGTLRRVSALRALCLSLPHVPTPLETTQLERFAVLVTAPGSATAHDLPALAAGWRRWWREGRAADIAAMAERLPAGLVESDRDAVTYAAAARLALKR